MSTDIVTNEELIRIPKGVSRKYALETIAHSISHTPLLILSHRSSVLNSYAESFRSYTNVEKWLQEPFKSWALDFGISPTLNNVLDDLFKDYKLGTLQKPYTITENETEMKLGYSKRNAELSCVLSDAAHYNTTAKAIQHEYNHMTIDELMDYLVRKIIVQRTSTGDEPADTDAMLLLGEILFNEACPYTLDQVIMDEVNPSFFSKYGYNIEQEGLIVFEILAAVSDQKYGEFYHSALLASNAKEAIKEFIKHAPDHIAGKDDPYFMIATEKTTYEAPISGMEVIIIHPSGPSALLYPSLNDIDEYDIHVPEYCVNRPEDIAYFGSPDTRIPTSKTHKTKF